MRPGCWIGNDVVDLAEAGVAGKERDARFAARVFTAAERARILADLAPAVALWKTWAAKETAFKVARKLRDSLLFAHRAFEVTMERPDEGVVRFEDLVVRVRWQLGPGYVHCVGFAGAHSPSGCAGRDADVGFSRIDAGVLHDGHALDGHLTAAEAASVHSPASRRARLLARQLLERWRVGEAEIVRRWRASGWSAPMVARRGHPVDAFDVSLSHDGRFVAAAVSGPPGQV